MTYDELCTAVGKVDKEAEQYMRTDIKKLKDFDPNNNLNTNCPAEYLLSIFVWSETPQGHKYWSNIENQLT